MSCNRSSPKVRGYTRTIHLSTTVPGANLGTHRLLFSFSSLAVFVRSINNMHSDEYERQMKKGIFTSCNRHKITVLVLNTFSALRKKHCHHINFLILKQWSRAPFQVSVFPFGTIFFSYRLCHSPPPQKKKEVTRALVHMKRNPGFTKARRRSVPANGSRTAFYTPREPAIPYVSGHVTLRVNKC